MFDSPIGRRAALRRLSLALGGIATAPLATGLLSGCRTPERETLADYAFSTLNEDQQQLLTALVDHIIPASDTPGAAEAGVPQFIDTMLTDWYAPDERDRFLAGLAGVDQQVEGGSFVGLVPEAQAAAVEAMDAEEFGTSDEEASNEEAVDDDVAEVAVEGSSATTEEAQNEVAGMQGDLGDVQDADSAAAATINTGEGTVDVGGDDRGPSFYRQLKELTVAGYYTSEVGASQELQWNPAPGRLDADVPLSEIGRAWA